MVCVYMCTYVCLCGVCMYVCVLCVYMCMYVCVCGVCTGEQKRREEFYLERGETDPSKQLDVLSCVCVHVCVCVCVCVIVAYIFSLMHSMHCVFIFYR